MKIAGIAVYTTKEAAKHVGLAEVTIRQAAENGHLKASKSGRDWNITEKDLQHWYKNRRPRGNPGKKGLK